MTVDELADLLTIAATQAYGQWITDTRELALRILGDGYTASDPGALALTAAQWREAFTAVTDAERMYLLDTLDDGHEVWIDRWLADLADRYGDVPLLTADRLQGAIRDTPDPVDELARLLDPAEATWQAAAEVMGRTEATALHSATAIEAAAEAGGTKTWVCHHDERTRASHLAADGQTVPLGWHFDVGGAHLQHPGDHDAPPELTANCRCTVRVDPLPQPLAASEGTSEMTTVTTFTSNILPIGVMGRSQTIMVDSSVELVDTKLPLPFKYQSADEPGHDGGVVVGAMETCGIVDDRVQATGPWLDTDTAEEARERAELGVSQPSSEVVLREAVATDENGNELTDDEMFDRWWDDLPIVMSWRQIEVVGATLVSVPEFRETSIEFTDTESTEEEAMAASRVAMAASARIIVEDEFPPEWFENPNLPELTYVHITPEGRVVGHVNSWKQIHIGLAAKGIKRTVNRSATGYAYFHQAPVRLTTGERIRVGRATVGKGHGPVGDMRASLAHYDDATTCWAYLKAGEDEHGVWVSGAINPNAPDTMVKEALRAPVSGHWEPIGGVPEMIAVHSVNTPGLPLLHVAENPDGDLAMVASLGLPPGGAQYLPRHAVRDLVRFAVDEYRRGEANDAALAARKARVAQIAAERTRVRRDSARKLLAGRR